MTMSFLGLPRLDRLGAAALPVLQCSRRPLQCRGLLASRHNIPSRRSLATPAHRPSHILPLLPSRQSRCFSTSSTFLSERSPRSPASTTPLPPSPPLFPHAPAATPPTNWTSRIPNSLRWTLPYINLMRLDKPIGTWLLFWPCAWALTQAAYTISLPPLSLAWNIALFGTGALIMRGAGCTINDLWDMKIDRKVERTKERPLASGAVTPFKAVTFLGLQLSLGLAVLTQLNMYSIFLGASSLAVVVVYPLMKRITYWPQLVLGLAFNWGALLGSSAILGYCDWAVALPLYFGSLCWTIVYDTIYAHQDKVDDVTAGVKSTALLFGQQTKPILSLFSLSFLSLLSLSGYLNAHGLPFWLLSVGGSAAHLAWQIRNVDLDQRASCWDKFKSNRDLGFIVWSGLVLDYLAKFAGFSLLLS